MNSLLKYFSNSILFCRQRETRQNLSFSGSYMEQYYQSHRFINSFLLNAQGLMQYINYRIF